MGADTAPKLHLIKLSVGSESVESLMEWQHERCAERARVGADPRPRHVTRMFPRRAAELLDGGSIYWVIQRNILARQRLAALEPVRGEDGIERCALIMDTELIRTEPRPRRPFQGWRYLKPEDAPPDLTQDGQVLADMPSELRNALGDLGIR